MSVGRKVALGVLPLALVFGTAAKCDVTVTPPPNNNGGASPTTSAAPTSPVTAPPAVVIDGDAGLNNPFTVVKEEDLNSVTEVQAGVYVSEGALDGDVCEFVQLRKVELDVVAEVAVSDVSLDADQAPVAEPAPKVVKDNPNTEVSELEVTLVAGDVFKAEGCQDFVLQD